MSEPTTIPRRHQRIAVDVPVRISTIDPEEDASTGRRFFRLSEESCINVSRGGAFIRTVDDLPPGQRLLVELQLPNGRRIETIGRVAWSRAVLVPEGRSKQSGIGVEFLGGKPEQFTALEDFIAGLPKAGETRSAD